jgi:AcrR family transcriptional regulator
MTPRPYRLGARRAAIDDTRRRIVDAVVALHAEKGVIATRFQDIAQRADVALGTVYRHFPTLDTVVRACGERLLEITRPPAPEILADEPSPGHRLRRLVGELFAFYERARPWLEVQRAEAARVPALAASGRRHAAAREALVRQAMGPAVADRAERAVLAFTDFAVWKTLAAESTTAEAAALVSEVLLGWLPGGQGDPT